MMPNSLTVFLNYPWVLLSLRIATVLIIGGAFPAGLLIGMRIKRDAALERERIRRREAEDRADRSARENSIASDALAALLRSVDTIKAEAMKAGSLGEAAWLALDANSGPVADPPAPGIKDPPKPRNWRERAESKGA